MSLSHKQVQKFFRDRKDRHEKWKRKEKVHARQLDEKEEIVVNNGQTQQLQPCDEDEWVVRNSRGEQYKLSAEQFDARFELDPEEPDGVHLREEGFGKYTPKVKVDALILTEQDVAEFPNRSFLPAWDDGEITFVSVGGALVLPEKPAGNPTEPEQVYYIPKDIFEHSYHRSSKSLLPDRWLKAGACYEEERWVMRGPGHVDGFNTEAKVLLPDDRSVFEACVRPPLGEDEPGFLVVTTEPELRLLVFQLDTFDLRLNVSLEKDLHATNFSPFCSFHKGDFSLLHVSYKVIRWDDLVSAFGKDQPDIKVTDSTMSRFAVFTLQGRVVWKQQGEEHKRGLNVKRLGDKPEAQHVVADFDHTAKIDPFLVASTTKEEVFVVRCETTPVLKRVRFADLGDDQGQDARVPEIEGKIEGRTDEVELTNGRLVPFTTHPDYLFVAGDDQDNNNEPCISLWSQGTLEMMYTVKIQDPAIFPGVRLSPCGPSDLAKLLVSSRTVHKILGDASTLLAEIPHELDVVAVHGGGVIVTNGHGQLLSLAPNSHPLLRFERKQQLLGPPIMRTLPKAIASRVGQAPQAPGEARVCTDPNSQRLVVAHDGRLWVFQDCRAHNDFSDAPRPVATDIVSGVRAMCVDWVGEHVFVADDDNVVMYDFAGAEIQSSAVEYSGVTQLCAVRAHSGGVLFVARKDPNQSLRCYGLDDLKEQGNVGIEVRGVTRLVPLGDCAVVVGTSADGKSIRMQRLHFKGGAWTALPSVRLRTRPETLGSVDFHLVGALRSEDSSPHRIVVFNRTGLTRHSFFTHGEVTHVATEQGSNCVVFVTKTGHNDTKSPLTVRLLGAEEEGNRATTMWTVCALMLEDGHNSNSGGDVGKGYPVGTQWQLASFRSEVKSCHVMKHAVVVHCEDCVRVIDKRACGTSPTTHKLFDPSFQADLLGSEGEAIVRWGAGAQEVFWARLLRRPDALDAVLTQTRLRLLPVVPIPDLLRMVLDDCPGPQQGELLQIVLRAYVECLTRHNERRRRVKGAKEGWEVDFQMMDQHFLKTLVRIVRHFPDEAAEFMRDVPLVRLRSQDEARVFHRGVHPKKEAKAKHDIVVTSSDELDGADWGEGKGQRPTTVEDYVVPFPSHASDGDDLLVEIGCAASGDFVDGLVPKTIIAHRWNEYASGTHLLRSLLYLLGLALTVTLSFLSPSSTSRRDALGVLSCVGALLLVSLARRLGEFVYGRYTLLQYLAHPFHFLELARMLLTAACIAVFIVAADWGGGKGQDWVTAFRMLVSVLAFAQWLRLLRLLQPYRQFGPHIRMLTQIAWHVKYLLVVLAIAVLAIANALLAVLTPGEKAGEGTGNQACEQGADGFSDVAMAIFSSFKLTVLADTSSVEDVDVANVVRQWQVRVLLLLASLIGTVVLMNLLIADMSDMYEHIQERAEVEFQRLRAETIVVQQAHYGPMRSFLHFALGSNAAAPRQSNAATPRQSNAAAPRRSNAAAPRRSNAAALRQSNAAAPRQSNAVVAGQNKGVRYWATWLARWLLRPFAYPMHISLHKSGARPEKLYDAWLHVLVPHTQSLREVNTTKQWLGMLADLKAQLAKHGAGLHDHLKKLEERFDEKKRPLQSLEPGAEK